MSKRIRNLIVIGIFILSMAIVLLVLVLTQPKEEVEETTEDQTIQLLNYNRDDALTATIKNEAGEYTIRNGVSGFVIDKFNGFRQNSTTMGAAVRCATELTAQALVEENAQDLEKYGLAEGSPKAACDIELKDGTKYSVYFGIDAPDGKTRYVRLADSRDVYTVLINSSGYFYNADKDFISLVVTDELTNNNTAPTLDRMVIKRKDLDYDIEFIDDSKNYSIDDISMASAQVMISPVYAYLDITNSNAIMYGLWGLTAYDVEKVHPTEEDFEKYGLSDPFCEVNLEAELQTYNIKIGNVAAYQLDENGEPTSIPATFYCYYQGIDIIYVFESGEVPWATFMPIDILSSMMTANYIYTLDYIDVNYLTGDKETFHFDLSPNMEEKYLTGTVNGEEFEEEDFKKLYQFMLKCPIDDLCFEDPSEDAKIAEMIFHRSDGNDDSLGFYDLGNNRVAVKLNGQTSFSQPIGYINVLKQNIELFMNKEALLEVW